MTTHYFPAEIVEYVMKYLSDLEIYVLFGLLNKEFRNNVVIPYFNEKYKTFNLNYLIKHFILNHLVLSTLQQECNKKYGYFTKIDFFDKINNNEYTLKLQPSLNLLQEHQPIKKKLEINVVQINEPPLPQVSTEKSNFFNNIFNYFSSFFTNNLNDKSKAISNTYNYYNTRVCLKFLGDYKVGKTFYIKALTNQTNDISKLSEITILCYWPTISIKNKNNLDIKMELWDTSGQESYFGPNDLCKSFLRGSKESLQIICLCIDLTNRESLQSFKKWKLNCDNYIKEYNLLVEFILLVLKCDDKNENLMKITDDELEEISREYLMPYLKVSAIEFKNINALLFYSYFLTNYFYLD
ncbi:hypothetical protein ABK040_009778 [Willaertia magna]